MALTEGRNGLDSLKYHFNHSPFYAALPSEVKRLQIDTIDLEQRISEAKGKKFVLKAPKHDVVVKGFYYGKGMSPEYMLLIYEVK